MYRKVIKILKMYPQLLTFRFLFEHIFPHRDLYDHKSWPTKEYMRLYRHLIHNPDFYSIWKMDGILFVSPTVEAFDLIQDLAKFQLSRPDIYDLPKKAHDLRIMSIKTIQNINVLNYDLRSQLIQNFKFYIDDINQKLLCFKRVQHDLGYLVTTILPYKTRFNDKARKVEILSKYEYALDKASNMYKKGVFLTLTTDPKLFDSLWQANRHFSKAWNKFLSFLARKKKKRPKYIATYEYTKVTGLMHAHIIIFGTLWLAKHKDITTEWERCGQGHINYEYAIHNDKGKWRWTHERPKSDPDNDAGNYLKKYLKKAMFSNEHLELYWTFNKRFLTCSRHFISKSDKMTTTGVLWKFIGAWSIQDIPEDIYQSSNLNLNLKECDFI